MSLIDTHCHLNMPPLGDDPAAVLARAAARSVTRVIVPAYDLASWPAVDKLSVQQKVFSALGLHPWAVVEAALPDIQPTWKAPEDLGGLIRQAIKDAEGKVVAIGEIGLDAKIENSQLKTQQAILEAQLDLAVDLDLPVILHCRGAFDQLLAAIDNHQGKLRGVLHAFSRSPEVAERFIGAGLHIGLGGAVTRPTARRVRKAAASIPLEKIVLETDAPSIGLDGVLPENTEPQHVADVARALAELREVSVEEISRQTTLNAEQIFRI